MPALAGGVILLMAMLISLLVSPPDDFRMGRSVLWLYVHAPAAMAIIVAAGVLILVAIQLLIDNSQAWRAVGRAAARVGALAAIATLISGANWSVLIWGTYWEWDPVTTSLFVLLAVLSFLWARFELASRTMLWASIWVVVFACTCAIYGPIWWISLHTQPFNTPIPPEFEQPLLLGFGGAALLVVGVSFIGTWTLGGRARQKVRQAASSDSAIDSQGLVRRSSGRTNLLGLRWRRSGNAGRLSGSAGSTDKALSSPGTVVLSHCLCIGTGGPDIWPGYRVAISVFGGAKRWWCIFRCLLGECVRYRIASHDVGVTSRQNRQTQSDHDDESARSRRGRTRLVADRWHKRAC